MYRSQQLALKYFVAAITPFGIMVVAGMLSSIYHVRPGFLLNTFNFSTAKILHIDTLVIWLLMGFFGAIYWFLPNELGREVEGIALAEIFFYIFCAAVAVVAVVFISIQYGGSTEFSLWFINQGRKYVEAPRWAAIGIVLVVAVFMYNVVGTALKAGKITGIVTVLIVDLVPLFALYLDAFPAMRNMSQDLFWWWWLVHLWVEATWEVLIACIMALALMHLLGTARWIVESWLYVEVALVLGTGVLGLRVSPRTIGKYLPKLPATTVGKLRGDQRWSTFLKNHAQAVIACDFCGVATATFRLLYVFVMMEHLSRRIIHFNVTAHPTAAWTVQQLREAIPSDQTYRFLIYDRDAIFSTGFDASLARLGLEVIKTLVQSPKANSLCERLIGTLRREFGLNCAVDGGAPSENLTTAADLSSTVTFRQRGHTR
jgi:hypothetical protein